MELIRRPRRNRKSKAIRALVQENFLTTNNLCSPHFIVSGKGAKEGIKGLPGMFKVSIDQLLIEIEQVAQLGIQAIALFPVVESTLKNVDGQEALNPQGLIPKAVKAVKKAFPDLCVITDIALDPFTTHGHDGIPDEKGEILNDVTVARLVEMALIHAEAGVDIVAPSDMMDGRVLAIRKALDAHHFQNTSILSYTAKYASQFYGPYRDALGSNLKFGDKKGYFMDPANKKEALLEATLDIQEGADILMVKPALIYLDVIAKLSEATLLPIAAYHVSGEYAMIQAAAEKGWIDANAAYMECALAMRRAGASLIFTYAARTLATQLVENQPNQELIFAKKRLKSEVVYSLNL